MIESLMQKWWRQHKTQLKFLKSDQSQLIAKVAAHTYSSANVQQLEAVALSFMKYKGEFLKYFDSKNLDEALSFSIYFYMILQVFIKFEPYMSESQKIRFRRFTYSKIIRNELFKTIKQFQLIQIIKNFKIY